MDVALPATHVTKAGSPQTFRTAPPHDASLAINVRVAGGW